MKLNNKLFRVPKPTRDQLGGFSPSEFKTLLKRRGYKVSRTFFKDSIASYSGRLYRFRYWCEDGFVVDVSCPRRDFDRWANSVDAIYSFDDWLKDADGKETR